MPLIPRLNISGELANTLRNMIFDGELADGTRLNEVHLAAQLGVSRTPLREAMGILAVEEALVRVPRKGFFVRELTRKEFEDLYPIRGLLEPEALRLSGFPSEDHMARLEAANEAMAVTDNPRDRPALDEEWHQLLISNCRNQELIDLITLIMIRFRRYGMAFVREKKVVAAATREHLEILEALKRRDMAAATEWLRRNLTSNKAPVLEWLEERQPSEDRPSEDMK
ncbi:MAG: GntR family transcriptional regulator [Thermoanaerobaculia bacterium]